MMAASLTVGSLFAGIGGFDLAAERAGMTVVWQSENDPHASRVLDHHWPHVKNLGDVHGITDAPAVDVLTGGFPCQDYSVAGRGAGLAGDRGALWWQFHRLIADLSPRWVVGENVHGLTTRAHRDSLRTIIGSLVRLGYGVAWRVFDAQWFGVAQRRRRVFVVGHSGGQPRPEVLALAQSVCGDTPPSREEGKVSSALTEASAGGSGLDDQAVGHLISFNWQTGGDGMLSPRSTHTDALHVGQTPAVAFAQNQRDEVRELGVASSLNAERWGTAKNETLLAIQGGSQQDQFIPPDGVSPTLAHASNTHSGHHEPKLWDGATVRRLTPLEAERLQGFPDHFTAIPGNSDTQRYRQLGNAVAVPVVEWILEQLAATDERTQ